jgi:hypothetical protein
MLTNLGLLYTATQQPAKAGPSYLEALSIWRRLCEVNPDSHLPDLVEALHSLAALYFGSMRTEEARSVSAEAYAIFERLWREQPELHGNQMARIFSLRALLGGTKRRGVRLCQARLRGCIRSRLEANTRDIP